MEVTPFFIKAITPLHVGSGSDLGVVDLPIQREVHTGFPKIEASSLKGAIRKHFEDSFPNENEKIQVVFGCDGCEFENRDYAAALGFTDAKILFFPVKSVKGVFAYVTCPMVLERFKNEIEHIKKIGENDFSINIPEIKLNEGECAILEGNINLINDEKVILEEYSFQTQKNNIQNFKIPNLNIDIKRVVIISDDDFRFFVKNSTEIVTRIKINNETGVVQTGGLFTEEYLPSETILYSLAIAENPYIKVERLNDLNNDSDVMKFFEEKIKGKNILQIGGNSTLGKGICEIILGDKNESK